MRATGSTRGGLEGARATHSLSSPDLIGRSSIPEAAVIEPRGCGVLDAPVKPWHDSVLEGRAQPYRSGFFSSEKRSGSSPIEGCSIGASAVVSVLAGGAWNTGS